MLLQRHPITGRSHTHRGEVLLCCCRDIKSVTLLYSHALLSGEGRRCRTLDAMRTRSAATTGLIIQCSATRSCSSPIVTSHCANNQTPFSIVGSHQSTSQPRLTNRGPVVMRLIQPCRAGPHREALHIIHRGSIVLLAAAETSNYGKVAHSSR